MAEKEKKEQQDRALIGMKEICNYLNRSEPTVLSFVRQYGLPAKKIKGQWESNTALIDKWRREQIETDAAPVAEPKKVRRAR